MRYEDMEYENFKNILEEIDKFVDPSRAMIAKHLSLSRTTLSNIATILIDKQILVEGETKHKEDASRGRPGTVIRYCEDKWFALGAAFYASRWNFVLCSLSGKVVNEYSIFIRKVTPEKLISKLLDGIEHMLTLVPGQILPAVGIGAPGVVDTQNGAILWAYDLKWYNPIDIKTAVKARFGLDSYCYNRYILAGLAEYRFANPEREQNLVYLGIGSGIRSVIFVNGKILQGASFSSGRIAHIPIDPQGPLCECGKRGCLLHLANEQALFNNAKELAALPEYSDSILNQIPNFTLPDIISYADTGDSCCIKAMDRIIDPIIKAITILVDIINPKKIVLGGPIGYSSKYLAQRVDEATNKIASETPYRVMTIVPGKLKEDGAALGAAALVLDKKCDLLYSQFKSDKQ